MLEGLSVLFPINADHLFFEYGFNSSVILMVFDGKYDESVKGVEKRNWKSFQTAILSSVNWPYPVEPRGARLVLRSCQFW